MDKLYFHINGSGSPFWREEKINISGNYYYNNLFWPENPSIEFKNLYNRILTLFKTYRNPIDLNFPSLWTQEMCDLYNQFVNDFFELSKSELKEYTLINKNKDVIQDVRLISYRQNIIKSHLEQNKTFNNEKEFQDYFQYKTEVKSVLTTELPFEQLTRITQSEFNTLNQITLNFGHFDNCRIAICPYSYKTYISDINIGGHGPVFNVLRINRGDIFNDQLKLIRLFKTLNF